MVACTSAAAGGEIFDQIIRSGYMSEKVAAEKTGQLLSFLAHAHSKHVIHRWAHDAASLAGFGCIAGLELLHWHHRGRPCLLRSCTAAHGVAQV